MNDIIGSIYGQYAEKSDTIECLDNGFVKIVDCMPRLLRDAEDTSDYAIAEAARCSYQRGTKTIADDKTLIRYLLRHNHTSPFEMVEFKFHCKMPMFVARQWIRHRTASVNELSGRYSEMPEEYYIPTELRVQSQTNTQGSDGRIDSEDETTFIEWIGTQGRQDFSLYEDILGTGAAREQARIVLPLSTYTEWFWKIDLHNLLHFLDLRCDSHAQKEIQVYGDAILELIRPIVPWTIEAWEDYSTYRGGMVLTRYEVEALKEYLQEVDVLKESSRNTELKIKDISAKNKLENREWKEKSKRLGF